MARGGSIGSLGEMSLPPRTLIVDPGAYTIKAGFTTMDESTGPPSANDCHIIPNCIARSRDKHTYIGSELEDCADFGEMAFRRPMEKGYIVNWDAERAIWEHEFLEKNAKLHCDPHECNLIMTEPSNATQALQTNCDQIVFEEFEFASSYRCVGPSLNAWNDTASLFNDSRSSDDDSSILPTEIMLLIDSGYSHTTITPLVHGRPIHPAIRRLTIGGKHLSAYLAELVSLRHFSLIDEPHIVSQIKEDACFVSPSFAADLDRTWKGGVGDRRAPDPDIVVDYVLPDYDKLHRGYMRPHDASHAAKMARLGVGSKSLDSTGAKEEVFPLGNERFVVPELLFSPSDIGMQESGIPETVMQSLANAPRALWQGFLGNVVLVGGCALLPGFVERVEDGLRMLAPEDIVVRVKRAEDPIRSTWQGGARLATQREQLQNLVVTRQDYMEHGPGWTARQFASRRPHQ